VSQDNRLQIQSNSTITSADVTHDLNWWRGVLRKVDAKWHAAKAIDEERAKSNSDLSPNCK